MSLLYSIFLGCSRALGSWRVPTSSWADGHLVWMATCLWDCKAKDTKFCFITADMDECSFSEFLCQHECVNGPGSYYCICPSGYNLLDDNRSCQDINECENRNFTCTPQQTCFNIPGEYKCLDPVRCEDPYVQINENRCMCPAENAGCRDQPFTILYRVMDMVSGRSVPSDIFQMQATTRYPGAYYIFQIKSGNEGREFYMRQTGPISATLVMTRPVKGPRTIELDLEMITVNTVINFRGSSVIRLRIYVSQYSF